jgi:hypothetical protein
MLTAIASFEENEWAMVVGWGEQSSGCQQTNSEHADPLEEFFR